MEKLASLPMVIRLLVDPWTSCWKITGSTFVEIATVPVTSYLALVVTVVSYQNLKLQL
jgi:hypothetical protein